MAMPRTMHQPHMYRNHRCENLTSLYSSFGVLELERYSDASSQIYVSHPFAGRTHKCRNSPGKSMSMNWQYAAPLHISSILAKRESSDWLTQASMSCRERLSVVTDVEYTLTAILSVVEGGHLKEDVFPD